MTPDAPPEVTAVRATVKAPAPGARFTVHLATWLGDWACAVVEALTRKAPA